MPALKPITTGSDMKLATKPSRSRDASTSMAPTNSVSVAEAVSNDAGSAFGATSPSSAVARIASVVGRTDAEYARAAQDRVDWLRMPWSSG